MSGTNCREPATHRGPEEVRVHSTLYPSNQYTAGWLPVENRPRVFKITHKKQVTKIEPFQIEQKKKKRRRTRK